MTVPASVPSACEPCAHAEAETRSFTREAKMAICPICGKLSDDELDTNKGLCSLECQEQWHRVVEIIVPP